MKNNFFNLKNKIVFIIGGSGFLGQDIAEAFLEFKSKVINLDIKKNKKISKKINYYKFDSTDLKNLKKNILKIIKKNGIPDVVINASYPHTKNWSKSNFENIQLSNYEKNINLHLNSFIWSAKIFADIMKVNKKEGSIVLLNSIYGIIAQDLKNYKNTNMKENLTYSVIKGAITNFVRQMASFYGKFKIRVNSVCLGGVKGHVQSLSSKQNKTFIRQYISKTPLGRMGESKDITGAIILLSSDQSSYITGSNLVVDGGYTIV